MTEERKNTIWIDLTDLLAWKGHFSGIQRVVFTYAQRYYREGAHFFVYNPAGKPTKIIEVSGDGYFTERVEGAVRKRDRVKQAYRKAVPSVVRRISSPLIRKALHYVFLSIAQVKWAMQSEKQLFCAGDTVLLLGAPWESEGLIQELAVRKAIVSFRLVHFLHDVLPLSQPQLFDQFLVERFASYMETALPLCDGLMSASQATLNDVSEFVSKEGLTLPEQQEIVREGEDTYTAVKPVRPVSLQGVKDDFIFCLGTLEVRKNHQLLYQAYKLAQAKGIKLPRLVIVGRPGWLARDFFSVLMRDTSLRDQITVISGASDAEVLWLYEHCLFTIYPSLCEGWGLTIADSLGRGKLCLTSNTSSMPEVAGDLGDYFSPYDSHDCMQKISYYASHRDALNEKELKIRAYRPYTWQQSFACVKAFVEQVD